MHVRLKFEGIRCFSSAQDAIVRPLTLLVGENSSGKSTFLDSYAFNHKQEYFNKPQAASSS